MNTNMMLPVVCSIAGIMGFPLASQSWEISYSDRMSATTVNAISSAKTRPGQLLVKTYVMTVTSRGKSRRAYRRPKPKTMLSGWCTCLLSKSTQRSGSNLSGSAYTSRSRSMPLRMPSHYCQSECCIITVADAPYILDDHSLFSDVAAVVDVVFAGFAQGCVKITFSVMIVDRARDDLLAEIGGITRRTSDKTALVYGSLPRSAYVGRRSRPMTRSISACAFLCTSGCRTIMRINPQIVEDVCQDVS